jgi:hypothetical protein
MFNKDNFDLNNLNNMDGIDNLNLDGIGNLIMLVGTVASIVLIASLFSNYITMNQVSERAIDLTRAHQGLPTDVSIDPSDFTSAAEYADFMATLAQGGANNVNIALESSEHSQYLDFQEAAINPIDYIDLLEPFRNHMYLHANDIFQYIFFFLGNY